MSWVDDFNDSSLDATKFGTSVAGSGSVTEGTDYLTVATGAAADAAIVYLQNKLDQTTSEFFIHKWKATVVPSGMNVYPFEVMQKTTAPAVGAVATINPALRILVNQSGSTGAITIAYFNSSSVFMYWTGSTWSTTNSPLAGVVGTNYIVLFVHTAAQWKIVVMTGDGGTELAHTDWVNFSALASPYDQLWVFWGEVYTDVYYGTLVSDWFKFGNEAILEAWYNGQKPADQVYSIGRAISYNSGLDFVKEPKTAILDKTPFQSGEHVSHVKDAYVVKDGSTYYLWCSHYDTVAGKFSISCFTSSDGITWTRSGTAAKIAPGSGSDPDVGGCIFPVVVKDLNEPNSSRRWKIYYAGMNAAGNYQICLAFAAAPTDTTYTKYGSNPILALGSAGAFDDTHILPGDLVADGSTLRLFYGGYGSVSVHYQGGEATSTDWLSWAKVQTTPVLASRTSGATTITTLASGAITAVVAATAPFSAKEAIILIDSGGTAANVQPNRVEKINSGTGYDNTYPAARSYTSGKLKSLYFGGVFPRSVRKVGSAWNMFPSTFCFNDTNVFQTELLGRATGTAHDAWTYDLLNAPVLPFGIVWDAWSAENLALATPPVSFTPPTSLARDFRLEIESTAALARLFRLEAEATASLNRGFRLEAEARAGLTRPFHLDLEATATVARQFRLEMEARQLHLLRAFRLPIEWSGSILRRAFVLPFAILPRTALSASWRLEIEALAGAGPFRFSLPIEWTGGQLLLRQYTLPIEAAANPGRRFMLPLEWVAGRLPPREFVLPIEAKGALGRAFHLPIEAIGQNILYRQFRLPVTVAKKLGLKWCLPIEASGLPMGLVDSWNVWQKLDELFPDQWVVIPVVEVVQFTDTWNVKSVLGGRFTDTWRVLPQKLLTLYSGDIQLPKGSADKS